MNEGGYPEDIEDLVENLWAEISDERTEEKLTGKTLKNTVTPSRLTGVASQKAKSLLKYISEFKSGRGEWRAPATELILLEDDFDVVDAAFSRVSDSADGFLRTCPETPRHGVLDSIRVSRDNLRKHWKHLKEVMEREDENGCLILQPFTEATSSCVLAPQQFASVGVDHDGITAGHGFNLYFHLDESDTQLSDHMASIGHKLGEYELEFISQLKGDNNVDRHPDMEMYLTQVRGAPPSPPRGSPFTYKDASGEEQSADFDVGIPCGRVTVKEVRRMTGLEDVIYLEQKITKETMPEGFVVSEPNGSLLSHICAHCRGHGIPYIVAEVEVGQTWVEGSPTWGAIEPEGVTIIPNPYKPFTPSLMSEFNRGLEMSRTHWQRQQGWLAHFFHQWVGLNYNGSKSALLAGGFVGWMCKAILGLSLGEMRHSRRVKKNTSVEMFPVMTAMIGTDKWVDITETSEHATTTRQHYYAAMEKIDVTFEEMRDALARCVKEFDVGWNSGYGGTAWGECARRGMLLCDAVLEFQAQPDAETLKKLTLAVNSAKNAEHNNGFLYGKFLSKDAFNYSDVHVNEKTKEKHGLFPHSNKGIECMFRTFELARGFTEGTAFNADCSKPSVSWSSLFGFLKNTNANYWRENLICISESVPEYLREAAEACGPGLLHHGNKYSHKENFIPCGHTECSTCATHVEVIEQMRYTAEIGALMLTDAYPEAYLATTQKSAPVSYSVCKMLKSREYEDVKPRMWVEAWHGLKMKDPMYPMLSGLLTKFVKNQMGDNKDWTDAIIAISKEEEE